MTVVRWTFADVDRLDLAGCVELSDTIKRTMIQDDSPARRRQALALLRRVDERIAQAPASVEQRVASARDFLYPGKSDAVSQRAWASAVELHGSAAEAKRRGYSDPSENAA